MPKISPITNPDNRRNERTHTEVQKKNSAATVEGVLVNSFLKDNTTNMDEICDTMVISGTTKLPKKLNEDKKTKDKSLTPIIIASLATMAAVFGMSFWARSSAKAKVLVRKFTPEKDIESVTRIITINDEKNQAWYQIVQNPTRKTILAGSGVFALSAMAFIGKMFTDGFKDVWVKKREADIQKNLQENLIEVETQSFAGKIQINRSILSEKAKEFNEFFALQPESNTAFKNKSAFKKFGFKGKEKTNNEKTDKNNLAYFATGALTLTAIVGLGFLAIKNLRKGKVEMDESTKYVKSLINKLTETAKKETLNEDKDALVGLLRSIDAPGDEIREAISKLPIEDAAEKENFIKDSIFKITSSVTKIEKNIGGNGTNKPSFSSFTDDYKAFFYTWLMERDNKLFKNLFFGMTTLAAVSYGGTVTGEGLKEVQVKKMNADTELELQQKLVSTELRNFKAKKDAAINPLMEEFYTQVRKGKPKEELKTMADNILLEIKNGPPFVYS